MSTYKYCVMAACVLISAHSNIASFSWVLTRALRVMAPGSWVLKAANILHMSTYECSRLLTNFHECPWMAMNTHECGAMAPIALRSTNKPLWAIFSITSSREHDSMVPWVLMSTRECSWHHGIILLSAPEFSWVPISALEGSWELMSALECPWMPSYIIQQ